MSGQVGNGLTEVVAWMSLCNSNSWDSEIMLEDECVSDALHTCVFHNDLVTTILVDCWPNKECWFYVEAPWQTPIGFDMD